MLLIGYRLQFGELCTLLNIRIDPDADYVEDDAAREKLESLVLTSVKNTILEVVSLPDEVYYLGLSRAFCAKEMPEVMTSREMTDKIVCASITFRREIKKVGIFKLLQKSTQFPEPCVIQN
jgi:hypothetical protein